MVFKRKGAENFLSLVIERKVALLKIKRARKGKGGDVFPKGKKTQEGTTILLLEQEATTKEKKRSSSCPEEGKKEGKKERSRAFRRRRRLLSVGKDSSKDISASAKRRVSRRSFDFLTEDLTKALGGKEKNLKAPGEREGIQLSKHAKAGKL